MFLSALYSAPEPGIDGFSAVHLTDSPAAGCFWEKIAQHSIPHVSYDENCLIFLMADLLPGWDCETEMWNGLDSDDLGGDSTLIDTHSFTTDPWEAPLEELKARLSELRDRELDMYDMTWLFPSDPV